MSKDLHRRVSIATSTNPKTDALKTINLHIITCSLAMPDLAELLLTLSPNLAGVQSKCGLDGAACAVKEEGAGAGAACKKRPLLPGYKACMYVYIYMYIHVYAYTERKGERQLYSINIYIEIDIDI